MNDNTARQVGYHSWPGDDFLMPEVKTFEVEGRVVTAIWMPFIHIDNKGQRRDPGLYYKSEVGQGYQSGQGKNFQETWDFVLPSMTNNFRYAEGKGPLE